MYVYVCTRIEKLEFCFINDIIIKFIKTAGIEEAIEML